MTLSELKKHFRLLAYQNGRKAKKARYDKTRDRCLGRQQAYENAADLLEQLDTTPPSILGPRAGGRWPGGLDAS